MRMSHFWMIAVLLVGCGGTSTRSDRPASIFVKLEGEGRTELLAGQLEVVASRLENKEGRVGYRVELKNVSDGPLTPRIHLRFFDADYGVEYEKNRVTLQEPLRSGESRSLEGTLNFCGLPECHKIARMGISVSGGKP